MALKSRATTRSSKTSKRRTPRTTTRSSIIKTRKPGKGGRPRTWVFYGKNGTGKTTLFGSFPGRKLLINVRDDGDDSVADIEDLEVVDINCWQDLEDTYWWLHANPGKFDSIAIDTITQLQQMAIEELMANKKVHKKFANKLMGDYGTMTKSDWGDVSSLIKTWVTNYRGLDCQVVFIAQERTFNVDDDSIDDELSPEVGPHLSPSTKIHVCSAASVIGQMSIRRRTIKKKLRGGKVKESQVEEFSLRLGPSDTYITKLRKPLSIDTEDFLINPTYEDILETIKGE